METIGQLRTCYYSSEMIYILSFHRPKIKKPAYLLANYFLNLWRTLENQIIPDPTIPRNCAEKAHFKWGHLVEVCHSVSAAIAGGKTSAELFSWTVGGKCVLFTSMALKGFLSVCLLYGSLSLSFLACFWIIFYDCFLSLIWILDYVALNLVVTPEIITSILDLSRLILIVCPDSIMILEHSNITNCLHMPLF